MPLKTFCFLVTIQLSYVALAQIQVHEERLHHPVLTNADARVLDVMANPGDTSLIHQHSKNYCYVTIKGGIVWLESENNSAKNVLLEKGFIGGYYDNPEKTLIHRFANCSSNMIRLIAVENLSLKGNLSDSLYQVNNEEQLVVDNPYFRITTMIIPPNQSKKIFSQYPAVIVNLEDEALAYGSPKRIQKLGSWAYLNQPKNAVVINPLSQKAKVVFIAVKNYDSGLKK